MKKTALLIVAAFMLLPGVCRAAESGNFEMVLFVTRQDSSMDWWDKVPPRFGAHVSQVDSVPKGAEFLILPAFRHFGLADDGTVDITYDLTVLAPDGEVDESAADLTGRKGRTEPGGMLRAEAVAGVSFDPEDAYGEYTIRVTAYDHVTGQQVEETRPIELRPFSLPEVDLADDEWFFFYPDNPRPAAALARLLEFDGILWREERPIWSLVWFCKIIFEKNRYLLPHMMEAFEGTTPMQKKSIILLLSVMEAPPELPDLSPALREFRDEVQAIATPNPDGTPRSGDQLDLLWGGFFATGRVKPLRRIIQAFEYFEYAGEREEPRAGDQDKQSGEGQEKVYLQAVFRTAVWSVRSNCINSPLVFHYCHYLHRHGELSEKERYALGHVLNQAVKDMEKQDEADNPGE